MTMISSDQAQGTRAPSRCQCCDRKRKVADYGMFAPVWLCWACAVHRTNRKPCTQKAS